MKISIRLFTTLRELAGSSKETLNFKKNVVSVKDALDKLADKHGNAFKCELFNNEKEVRERFQILINGKNARSMKGLDTMLKEGDEVAILPPVGGG